ncbi:hypothetical protein TraAM80_00489 [Trypanosoma rangeli]|uniref:TOG domain-containing protein n=1 Tax=Trypanosoma rangeli TaxID=5698 RepID=A0A3R7MW28_TRYRA|nr:uncharacterized protein TraAM80_00489 [Trypanosoma rangeli]RNF12207.1 hypothetical protein TraAM80_00489 [Trypanosoma rangeli]|eukprot:RNF12207.1 hypothetical protein TraAM80_00489 [Trypanosoma rangeli]
MMRATFPSEEKYGPRLNMCLCHCSSEDADHPARALCLQGRNSIGWQSDKGCVYPQELGFAFEGEVELNFIRVLSHERKIASRIEFFVAEATDEEIQRGTVKPYSQSSFRRLGYVCFVSNADNTFGARELKTINIRQKCVYVKLLISRPYHSEYNIFHQVGIAALTSHGTIRRTHQSVPTQGICLVGETVEVPLDEMLPPRSEDFKPLEAVYDNGYEIDNATARRIGELLLLKEKAVAAEDYDLASALKTCLLNLESVGKELYVLEKQKIEAVEKEDYVSAKALKRQIDGLREAAYKIPTTVSGGTGNANESNRIEELLTKQEPTVMRESTSVELPETHLLPSVIDVNTRNSVSFDEIPVEARGFYEIETTENSVDYEARNNSGNRGNFSGEFTSVFTEGKEEWEISINRVILGLSGGEAQASVLQGEALTEAGTCEKVFGTYCCACLFGREGSLREAAIRAIISPDGFAALSTHSSTVMETLFAYMALPSRGLSDSVAGVVLACCEALQTIIKHNIPVVPPVPALIPYLKPLIPKLVLRSGDNNSRVREMAESVLMSFAEVAIELVVSALLIGTGKNKKQPVSARVQISRMNMLSSLIDCYGINGDGAASLEPDTVIPKAVLPCLQHSNGKVREAASRVLAKLLLVAPSRSTSYMKALKPSQKSLVEQQVTALKASAADVNDKDEIGTTTTPFPGKVLDENKTHSVGRSFRFSSGLRGANSAEKTCQFCGEFDENFSKATLDIHLIRACPMLCPCPLCDQVTEIANLQQHLTAECENRRLVRECPVCREAVRVDDIKRHIAAKKCIKAVPTHSVCPLCHARFLAGSAGWVAHLASPPGCPNNPRRHDGSGPIAG